MKSPMKSVSAGGKLNLFFMEMIIVLFFFSIASAVILNAFAASDRLSRESGRLERMSFCAQSAAEIFSETGSLPQTLEKLFGSNSYEILNIDLEGGGYASEAKLPLTEECAYSPENAELYMLVSVDSEEPGGLSEMHIIFTDGSDGGEPLYEIRSGAYLPKKGTVS
ncbi:MAG: hypothetical protein K2N60_02745 [Oscillospiraceae bacterium]|nr:hypothetical protein [Oscillospiraceae bacterium]